jgi:hypothetical protein
VAESRRQDAARAAARAERQRQADERRSGVIAAVGAALESDAPPAERARAIVDALAEMFVLRGV